MYCAPIELHRHPLNDGFLVTNDVDDVRNDYEMARITLCYVSVN